ncbi:MAG: SLC13 family permease [Bacteroidota bacterium]
MLHAEELQAMDVASISWEAWFTLGVIVLVVIALLRDIARPELILLGALGLLLFAGVVAPDVAFRGFSNPAVFTIGALYVVAAGVQRTEALRFLDRHILPRKSGLGGAMPRLMGFTALLSAFLNNTPIVAMLVPRVQQWSEKTKIPSSRLLMPLSYAAIIGGMCTLIGTSTNIVVSELLIAEGYPGLGMFDLAWVGLPAAIVVLIYFTTIGYRLLPKKTNQGEIFEDGLKECLFELKVANDADMIGESIEKSGLRDLGGAYLAHVQRGTRIIPASPEEILLAGDTLLFTGSASILSDLMEIPGLTRGTTPIEQTQEHVTLPLFEAVVSKSSDLVGKTLKDVKFRERYQGIVLGIQRQSEKVRGGVGRTPLQAGDLLLIEATSGFDKRWNENRNDFYLVAARSPEKKRPITQRAPIALGLLLLMVIAFTTQVIPLVTAAFVAALGMILTRCMRGSDARAAINFSVLAVIGAALGLGQAVQDSGLAIAVAGMIKVVTQGLSPIAIVAVIYIATNLLTELITNQAAAILMLPIGLAVAASAGLPPEAIAVTISIAASASFMTPFGYQTNLMVMSAGGYRFQDYMKAGMPVSFIVMSIAVVMVYFVWMA